MVQTSVPNAAAAKNGGVWGVRGEALHPFAAHTMHLRKNYRPAFTRTRVRSSGAGDEEIERQLLEEMQQLRGLGKGDMKTANESKASAVRVDGNSLNESFSLSETAKQGLEKVLIADFFFVLFSLGWLATGLMTKAAFGSTGLLDTWLNLWQWVFQPAIGVLMLGALVSGALSWLSNRGDSPDR